MSSRCRSIAASLCLTIAATGVESIARELRVCADPDNLPYSHRDLTGFENRIAQLIAEDMHARVSYAWLPDRRGFIRKMLNSELCDVIVGIPHDVEMVRTTAPYYRSAYVFVYRADRTPLHGFDDARLSGRRIGVQLVGNDLAATPPGHILAQQGHVNNVVGYTVYGEGAQGARMVAAVAAGEIDLAVMWGPQAGYFVRRVPVPLRITPARAPAGTATPPFEYSISMGVRKRDQPLQQELDDIIRRRQNDIDAILDAYGVPRMGRGLAQTAGTRP